MENPRGLDSRRAGPDRSAAPDVPVARQGIRADVGILVICLISGLNIVNMAATSRASAVMQQPHTITIVALGDSTTAGTPAFLSPLESPPDGKGNIESQFPYWLMKAQPGWKVLNRGVNGERSDQIRARFEENVVAARPNVVVILAGVNDVYQGRSAESVQHNLRAMYDRAREAGIPVVAGSIIPYNTATVDQNARMHAINAWIEQTAGADANITFCDTRAAAAAPDDRDRLASSPDGLHPGVEGYRKMADALRPVIESVLARRTSRGAE